MNYTLMPSLEHRALIKIAIALFNQDDIRVLMANSYVTLDLQIGEKHIEIEDKVMKKLLQLKLPERFKKEILGFIKPIVLQLYKWNHEDLPYFSVDLPNELCWTPQGTVDKKKTAEVLIKDENLEITMRYKLACIYCLEDHILELWNRMSEDHRKSFYNEEGPNSVRQLELVVLWTYDIKGEVNKLNYRCSPYQYAFEYAAVGGNKAATEYFFQKLTSREREESLIRTIGNTAKSRFYSEWRLTDPRDYHDVLCFLLSQINEEQQIEVFKVYSFDVLMSLLDWPWQNFFMETANRMWDVLSKYSYDDVLSTIVYRVINGYKDFNYQQLFQEFWKRSPNDNKRYVLGENGNGGCLLVDLFEIEDVENVKLILKSATVKEKEEIIFNNSEGICQRLIYKNKWDLLKFFFQECMSSKEVMIKFKEEFKRCRSLYYIPPDMWRKCFHLLEDLIHKDDKKRSMEEIESTPAKRLFSAEFVEVTHSIEK